MSRSGRILLTLCCLLTAGSSLAATQLENLRTAVHPDRTRVVFDLSGPADFRLIDDDALSMQLVIDDAELAAEIRQQLFIGTPIAYVTTDASGEGLRLNFELGQRVRTKTFALPPYLSRGDRIVVDFYATGDDEPEADGATPEFLAAARQGNPGEVGTIHSERPGREPKTTEPEPERETGSDSTLVLSGTWEHEWAVETGDADTQKFESVIEPRLDMDLGEDRRLTAIARLRLDSAGELGPDASRPDNYASINGPWANNEHGSIDLRELYLDARTGNVLWRLGKQQVVWGEADGIKVMDVVNPQSFREFILDDFDDSRIPLWMVNAEFLLGDLGSLQLLWIPDTTYHELAEEGTPFAVSSPLLIPQAPPGLNVEQRSADKPDNAFSDGDAGLRYSAFTAGWDITLNYLYHFQDLPVPYQYLRMENGQAIGVLAPEYERNHLVGATASNAFGAFTLRGEVAYNSDTFHVLSEYRNQGIGESAEISSVLGVDWMWEAQHTLLSAQWFQSHLPDFDTAMYRSETEHTLSLLYQRNFNYDTWTFEALGLYSVDRGDRWINLKLSHLLRDNLELWLGGDIFAGDKEGVYGQFSSRDRVLVGLELGF